MPAAKSISTSIGHDLRRGVVRACLTVGLLTFATLSLILLGLEDRKIGPALETGAQRARLAVGDFLAGRASAEDLSQTLSELASQTPRVNHIVVTVDERIIASSNPEIGLSSKVFGWDAEGTDEFVLRRDFARGLHLGVQSVAIDSSAAGEDLTLRIVAATAPWAIALVWLRGLAILAAILALGFGLGGFLILKLLRRDVTEPVEQLARVAQRVADGDMQARLIGLGDNEFGVTADAVNRLANTLISQAATLKQREQRIRNLFRGASDAWLLTDRDKARILDVNDQAVAMLRRPRKELLGKPLHEIVPPHEQEECAALPQQVSESSGIVCRDTLHIQAPDGTRTPVSMMTRALRDGEDSVLFISLRDISEQRRQQAEIERQLARVTALHDTISTCAKSLDLRDIYRALHAQITQAMDCDAMAIVLCDEGAREFTTEFMLDTVDGKIAEVTEPLKIALQDSALFNPVISERRPILVDRGALESRGKRLSRFGNRTRNSESILCVPMMAKGRVVGAISVQSYTPGAHSEDDLELLGAMASQAAMAIQNARLHRSTQVTLRTRDALHRITTAIGNSLNLSDICRTVYREITRLVPTDAFFVSMVHPDMDLSETIFTVDMIEGKRQELPGGVSQIPLSGQYQAKVVESGKPSLELREEHEVPSEQHRPFGDQTRRSLSLMYVPLTVHGGNVIGVMSVQSYSPHAYNEKTLSLLEEIAGLTALALERARLFNEVATSEARYRALIESSNVAIMLSDREDKIALWNCGAEQMFGHTSEEILGLDLSELFPDSSYSPRRVEEALRRHSTWTAEVQARHREGTALEVVLSIAEITDPQGEPIGRVVIASDLTEKKTLERALLQAQKMESIGTLAGGIAHDFNNLLTGILGYATYLKTQAEPGTRMARDLNQIERAAKRASELTAQLLAFSRKQQMRRQAVDINQVLDETTGLIGRTMGKQIRLEVDKAAHLPNIEADPTQVQQVLMNLAINARDAMLMGGTLTLQTKLFQATDDFCRSRPEMAPGSHVLIICRDTGKGMDEETVKRIFDPFFTTKPVGEGTGLGLAMVYGIVRGHGGIIEVDSEVGMGTEFRIYLPRGSEENLDSVRSQDEDDVRGGSEKVMLVDDEPMILRLGSAILERYGYSVLSAPSGPAAIELFRQHSGQVDLVVLDMVMPEMNGAELASRLRELDPQLRILLSSGYTLDADAEDLIQSEGLIGFLPKPYRMSQLVHHVRQALDKPLAATG